MQESSYYYFEKCALQSHTILVYKGLCGFVVYQTREREGAITKSFQAYSQLLVYQTREREGAITDKLGRSCIFLRFSDRSK
jgi:hypothetical protein